MPNRKDGGSRIVINIEPRLRRNIEAACDRIGATMASKARELLVDWAESVNSKPLPVVPARKGRAA